MAQKAKICCSPDGQLGLDMQTPTLVTSEHFSQFSHVDACDSDPAPAWPERVLESQPPCVMLLNVQQQIC